ncbi:hypothetical protein MUA23_05505 [Mammaliicoccus sciuri]|nr:hypothetical protein [Mammaliicoccus sciuri]UXU72933.1 hypothetical protein MUA23_05505 [Mammaliicoccus sciuri]
MENTDILTNIMSDLTYFDTSELTTRQQIILGKAEDLLEMLATELEED